VDVSETILGRGLARFSFRVSHEVSGSVGDLQAYHDHLSRVLTSWYLLALASGLALVGLVSVGSLVGGRTGVTVAWAAGIASAAFCLAGAVDATWRSLLISPVHRRYRRTHDMTNRGQRALRVAAVRYPTLAMQGIVGVAAAVCSAVVLSA
jgi:hypothetical protein